MKEAYLVYPVFEGISCSDYLHLDMRNKKLKLRSFDYDDISNRIVLFSTKKLAIKAKKQFMEDEDNAFDIGDGIKLRIRKVPIYGTYCRRNL